MATAEQRTHNGANEVVVCAPSPSPSHSQPPSAPAFSPSSLLSLSAFDAAAAPALAHTSESLAALSHAQAIQLLGAFQSLIRDSHRHVHFLHSSLIESVCLYEAAALAERKARALLNLLGALRITQYKTVEFVVDSIISVVKSVLSCDRCALYFVGPRFLYGVEPANPLNYDQIQSRRFAIGEDMPGRVAASGVIELSAGSVCCPVRDSEGSVIAVIVALDKSKQRISPPTHDRQEENNTQTRRILTQTPSVDSRILSFHREDSDILESLCDQLGGPLRRYLPDLAIDQFFADNANTQGTNITQLTASGAGSGSGSGVGGGFSSDLYQARSLFERYTSDSFGPQQRLSRASRSRASSFQFPSHVPPPLSSSLSLDCVDSLEFSVFAYSEADLVRLTMGIFTHMGLIEEFQINPITLSNFVHAVRQHYNPLPFHNFYHAFSTFHFSYYSLRHTNASEYLQPIDVLALMVASLAHDLAHPGNTNSFEINAATERSLRVNDIHVLENFHAHQTYLLLRDERCNIFQNLSQENQRTLRATIVKAILSTDMAKHFQDLKKLDEIAAMAAELSTHAAHEHSNNAAIVRMAGATNETQQQQQQQQQLQQQQQQQARPRSSTSSGAPAFTGMATIPEHSSHSSPPVARHRLLPFDPDSETDRRFLVNLLIHSSDLSGQVFPPEVARVWENRISQEFAAQSIKEKSLGLPVAPFMQGLDDPRTRAKLQVNFIEFVLVPWWKATVRIFPALDSCFQQLTANKRHYEAVSAGQANNDDALNETIAAQMGRKKRNQQEAEADADNQTEADSEADV